jgi:hypothetical protein
MGDLTPENNPFAPKQTYPEVVCKGSKVIKLLGALFIKLDKSFYMDL